MNNVGPGDLAYVVRLQHPENNGRICTVIAQIPLVIGGVWWFCIFRSPILTPMGLIPVSLIRDEKLRRISGPGVFIGETASCELTA